MRNRSSPLIRLMPAVQVLSALATAPKLPQAPDEHSAFPSTDVSALFTCASSPAVASQCGRGSQSGPHCRSCLRAICKALARARFAGDQHHFLPSLAKRDVHRLGYLLRNRHEFLNLCGTQSNHSVADRETATRWEFFSLAHGSHTIKS